MYYKDEGIILNSHHSTGADKVVEILLKYRGKSSVIFKGVNKSKSKKLNSAEMGNYVEIFFYRKSKDQLPYVREIRVKNHFYSVKKNPVKFLYLNYISELFMNLAHAEEENIKLFNFLLKILIALTKIPVEQLQIFIVYIEFRLIQVTGIMPDFHLCHRCHKNKGLISYFPDHNEIVCGDCRNEGEGYSITMDKKIIEQIDKINKYSLKDINSLKIDPSCYIVLDKIFKSIINIYLNKELRAYKILEKMVKEINIS